MHDQRLILLLTSCYINACTTLSSGNLPFWVNDNAISSGEVVCSAESLDPETAKIKAEEACLSSAMRSFGVTVTSKRLTVNTLTGLDSSEVTQSKPINQNVKCDWTARYLERNGGGSFRQWLKCMPSSASIPVLAQPNTESDTDEQAQVSKNANSIITKTLISLTVVPDADAFVIHNLEGARSVINGTGTTTILELVRGDSMIEIKKHGYHSKKIELSGNQPMGVQNFTVFLDKMI